MSERSRRYHRRRAHWWRPGVVADDSAVLPAAPAGGDAVVVLDRAEAALARTSGHPADRPVIAVLPVRKPVKVAVSPMQSQPALARPCGTADGTDLRRFQ
jgi:hypothetical protein